MTNEELQLKIKEICPIFKYEKPKFPSDCIFNISPSQIGKFFNYPSVWYKESVLGVEPTFIGNTATVTGTICHHVYKSKTEGTEISRDEINDQLIKYADLVKNPDLDVTQVMIDWPLVAMEVVNKYVIPQDAKGMLTRCEESIVAKVMPGIYVGGSCDRLEGTTVVDYKTVAKLPDQVNIPFDYRIQLLAYVYIYRCLGFVVDSIKIVYGVKPTKTIPARCIEVPKMIDYEDERLINNTLNLIGESVLICKEKPELTHLIFKSYDLKFI